MIGEQDLYKLYGITEGSWLNITSLLSYVFHYNYITGESVDFTVFYNDFYLDDDLKYKHWEQEETWLDQFWYIYGQCMYRPEFDNLFTFTKLSWEDFEKTKMQKYAVGAYSLKQQKWGDDAQTMHNYGMVWPMKNHFKRIKNKVCVFKPSDSLLSEHHQRHIANTIAKTFQFNDLTRRESQYDWELWLERIKNNYNVVEIEYRTPIREVLYHLSTCEFSFSATGGVAQTISVSLQTPTLLFGFKKSCNENFDNLIPLNYFDNCESKDFVDEQVDIAKNRIKNLTKSLEKFGVPIDAS